MYIHRALELPVLRDHQVVGGFSLTQALVYDLDLLHQEIMLSRDGWGSWGSVALLYARRTRWSVRRRTGIVVVLGRRLSGTGCCRSRGRCRGRTGSRTPLPAPSPHRGNDGPFAAVPNFVFALFDAGAVSASPGRA